MLSDLYTLYLSMLPHPQNSFDMSLPHQPPHSHTSYKMFLFLLEFDLLDTMLYRPQALLDKTIQSYMAYLLLEAAPLGKAYRCQYIARNGRPLAQNNLNTHIGLRLHNHPPRAMPLCQLAC